MASPVGVEANNLAAPFAADEPADALAAAAAASSFYKFLSAALYAMLASAIESNILSIWFLPCR